MTGLDPARDRILEVAAIATDWRGTEMGRFQAVVKVAPEVIDRRMVGPFWEQFATVRRHLVAQNQTGRPTDQVEQALLGFIDRYFDADAPVLLAGNSIHQDRRFIRHEWPALEQRLHYRMLDVSAWKVVFEGRFGVKFRKPEAHRALEDIQGSIAELQYYLRRVRFDA